IHEISRKPEFIGRVLMVEGYDITLARYLTSGVDVWLNNPIRPMEASGTSGMKAAMNGVPNLSILDGWWPEGFQGDNGWTIGGEHNSEDGAQRDADDAESLYHTLRYDVIPTYYRRNESGFSDAWVRICKRAMISSIPHFNTDRMVAEYTERFYIPASRHASRMRADKFARSKKLATWKEKVRKSWPKVGIERLDTLGQQEWHYGDDIEVRVKVNYDGLKPEDVHVEIVLFRPARGDRYKRYRMIPLSHAGEGIFEGNLHPDDTGDFMYQIRAYPFHEDLTHPLAMGLMTYLEED
ncbi:MAG TPA: alpha-glucan family phosphorylase, partial [Mariprofundaceae bacterium]|nr:alpha-glucan family phosphorylase [Mariprofundaceae bacterium]